MLLMTSLGLSQRDLKLIFQRAARPRACSFVERAGSGSARCPSARASTAARAHAGGCRRSSPPHCAMPPYGRACRRVRSDAARLFRAAAAPARPSEPGFDDPGRPTTMSIAELERIAGDLRAEGSAVRPARAMKTVRRPCRPQPPLRAALPAACIGDPINGRPAASSSASARIELAGCSRADPRPRPLRSTLGLPTTARDRRQPGAMAPPEPEGWRPQSLARRR